MSILDRIYDLALRGARGLAPLLPTGEGKVGRGLEGRRRDRGTFRDWAMDHRDPARPLAWFHAPSVGEGLQARAVLRALDRECSGLQTAYSFFSPSAEGLARRLAVDVSGYLPWDVQLEVEPVIDALRPDLVAFTKTEVWPGLTRAARRRGIPVVLVAATLPENAGRLRWPGRLLLRSTFGSLDRVLAISSNDGARFQRLGVPPDRIEVTGDPAMDAVLERVRETDPSALHLRAIDRGRTGSVTVVAGSTWEPDHEVLIPALTRLRNRMPAAAKLRLVIAPHEPDPAHLEPLEARLRAAGWESVRLGRLESAAVGDGSSAPSAPGASDAPDAVVVDRVGVLAELYTLGDVAFVGGGFGHDGLHSVLEPAAAGIPVLFGPHHQNARAAAELQTVGGGQSVADGASLDAALESWFAGPDANARRADAGHRALRYIEAHQGASRATARILASLISPRPPVQESP